MNAFEWDEEIPQPKPPVIRVSLCVRRKHPEIEAQYEPATLADIARAIGVSGHELSTWLASRRDGFGWVFTLGKEVQK